MTVRSYAGAAKRTTLSAGISNSALSFTVTAGGGTGYPTGTDGPFIVCLDTGTAGEEKLLCSGRTGDTFTVQAGGRGYDDTIASTHGLNAAVDHVGGAIDFREANRFVNNGGTLTAASAGSTPLVVKGAASQSANLLEAQDSSGAKMGELSPAGVLTAKFLAAIGNTGSFTVLSTAGAQVITGRGAGAGGATLGVDGGTNPTTAAVLYVRGVASQSGSLQEWQNSAGTAKAEVNFAGDVSSDGVLQAGGRVQGSGFFGGTLGVKSRNASETGLVVRGSASQTGNLQEWQNSAGTVLMQVAADGRMGWNAPDRGSLGTYVGSVGVRVGGSVYFMPYYS